METNEKNESKHFPEFMTKRLAGKFLGFSEAFIKELCDAGELIQVYPHTNNKIWKRGMIPRTVCEEYRDKLIAESIRIPDIFFAPRRRREKKQ